MVRRPLPVLAGLTLLAIASLGLALLAGSLPVTPGDVIAAFSGGDTGPASDVVRELRLPRALAAFAVGGLLALAGAQLQVLLQNPLADPYVLGVSGGAAFGALATMLLGLGGAFQSAGAAGGALASTLLVFVLAHGRGGWTPVRLLLTGVVVAAGWGALISFLLAIAPERDLRGMVFWLMGDLTHAAAPWIPLSVLAAGLALSMPLARSLNLLSRGEMQARLLGVETGRLRLFLYVAAAVLTATAVNMAGSVGFVGLVVPHMVRVTAGSDHRLLLPASVLLGGSLLAFADTAARTVFAPQQLPVGVITALLGVPLFLYLLNRGRGR